MDSVRVTEDDGVTLIPIWNQSETLIWAKFPATNSTYYLYWGNSEASAVWDINAVFEDVIGGVVLALPMDEGSGSTVYDYSGNNNDVNNVSSIEWVGGKNSYGVRCFEGSYLWNSTPFNFPVLATDNFTFSLWLYMDSVNSNGATFFTFSDGGVGAVRTLLRYSNSIYFWGRSRDVNFGIDYDIGSWVNVIIRYNLTYMSLFLDNVEYPSARSGFVNGVAQLGVSGENVMDGFQYYANCTYDNVNLFSTDLSNIEIYNLHNFYPDSTVVEGSVCCRVWLTNLSYTWGEVETAELTSDELIGIIIGFFAICISVTVGLVYSRQRR